MQPFVRTDVEVVRYAALVTVWGRWFILIVAVFQLAYRPSFWYPDDIEHLLLQVPLLVYNGLVHYRLRSDRPVTWHWMLALSALDIVLITVHAVIRGGYDNLVFLTYYPALGAFAVVFSSLRLNLAWTTTTAVVYAVVSVMTGTGLDLEAGQEKVLVARLAVMYLIVGGISLIVRFERTQREASKAMERRLQQERIDLAQTIHDTAAQTAYMIGLSVEAAKKLAGNSNPKLVERLAAIAVFSKSIMWELRNPIDKGRIFEGRELGRVLGSHTATFAKVTSVPTEMAQSGKEPPLPTEVRAGLFSIAHNALTNAFLHAQSRSVQVALDFQASSIRLSVSDDGIGLPEEYAERGRGFSGMERDADRIGAKLIVESGGSKGGTVITCVVPYESDRKGDPNVIGQ